MKIVIQNLRKLLWYIIIAMPIFAFCFSFIENSSFLTFNDFMSTNLGVLSNNVVYDCFAGVFGSSGLIPVFGSGILCYFTYFVCVEILHVFVDVLLFLPNVIHTCFDKIGGAKNDF